MLVDIIASVANCDEFLEGYFIDLTRQTAFSLCRLTLIAPSPSPKLRSLFDFYSRRYPNIGMIVPEKDEGISACLNLAIQRTESPYVTIANTDDRKRPDSLERHILELELNPDVDLVYSRSLLSRQPNETFDFHSCRELYPCYHFDGIRGLLSHNSPHHNPMWRRALHAKNGYFDTTLKSAADWDLWLRCVSSGSKFKMIDEVLGLYYFNPGGMSTNSASAAARSQEEASVRRKYS